MDKPKICFVCLNFYHLLTRHEEHRGMGGAELQQMLIARELLTRGYDVSFITLDHDPEDIREDNIFHLIPTFRPGSGLPGIGFLYPRLYKVWKALHQSGADIFYVRSQGFVLAPTVAAARQTGAKVLYCGASDSDFDPGTVRTKNPRDRRLYLWGVRRCDAYAVQNQGQLAALRKNFRKDATIVHNGFVTGEAAPGNRDEILWVGSIRKVKQPHLFIELARRFPNRRFVMIGGRAPKKSAPQKAFFEDILARAEQVPNLEFNGFIPFEQVQDRIKQADILVNTSAFEGFPNTFLQAWSRGIPVLTFVDPDGLTAKNHLGLVAGNIDEMAGHLKSHIDGETAFCSSAIKQFFDENLTIERTVDKLEAIFRAL